MDVWKQLCLLILLLIKDGSTCVYLPPYISPNCYLLMLGQVSFWEAIRGCHNSGGQLVVMETESEWQELAGVVLNSYYDVPMYVGGLKLPNSPTFWYTTGQAVPLDPGSHPPLNSTGCLQMDFSNGEPGSFVVGSCETAEGYICEIPEFYYPGGDFLSEEK